MKLLKHILVAVALLAAMLPCSHAAGHHEHGHDSASGRCAMSDSPCECHACDHQSCSDNIEIQTIQTPVSETIEQPSLPVVLFTLPEPRPASSKTRLPAPGILASLQTVQLLI